VKAKTASAMSTGVPPPLRNQAPSTTGKHRRANPAATSGWTDNPASNLRPARADGVVLAAIPLSSGPFGANQRGSVFRASQAKCLQASRHLAKPVPPSGSLQPVSFAQSASSDRLAIARVLRGRPRRIQADLSKPGEDFVSTHSATASTNRARLPFPLNDR
jgi:hypothetical protein